MFALILKKSAFIKHRWSRPCVIKLTVYWHGNLDTLCEAHFWPHIFFSTKLLLQPSFGKRKAKGSEKSNRKRELYQKKKTTNFVRHRKIKYFDTLCWNTQDNEMCVKHSPVNLSTHAFSQMPCTDTVYRLQVCSLCLKWCRVAVWRGWKGPRASRDAMLK